MMIPTITDYLYRLHHHKPEILMEIRKKRALQTLCVIAAIIAGSVLIWILY